MNSVDTTSEGFFVPFYVRVSEASHLSLISSLSLSLLIQFVAHVLSSDLRVGFAFLHPFEHWFLFRLFCPHVSLFRYRSDYCACVALFAVESPFESFGICDSRENRNSEKGSYRLRFFEIVFAYIVLHHTLCLVEKRVLDSLCVTTSRLCLSWKMLPIVILEEEKVWQRRKLVGFSIFIDAQLGILSWECILVVFSL